MILKIKQFFELSCAIYDLLNQILYDLISFIFRPITNLVTMIIYKLNSIKELHKENTKEQPSVQTTNEEVMQEDISENDVILFQPNTIRVKDSVEMIINSNQKGEHSITLKCNDKGISHIEQLYRYFELSQEELLMRGLGFLTITRDVEVEHQKIGIIIVDNNGVVIDVRPINIV